jgi:chemotaxis protein methyltransferase CheR
MAYSDPGAAALEALARRIEAQTGLQFRGARARDLATGVRRMARDEGFASEAAASAWLLAGPWDDARDALCARHLTVGETYFFREPRAFELLCDHARARFAGGTAGQGQLRLWSAGCCTGEEPYSMAMALRQALPALDPARVSILATDLNEDNLAIARAGLYRQWSFRRTPAAMRAAWFAPLGDGRHAIDPAIRAQVRFARLNLADDAYPSAHSATQAMDIIFCRNVLMYFSRRQAQAVIARLRACLVDGGWLVVNPSEASAELFEGFQGTYHPDAIFFQKSAGSGQRAAPAPVPQAAMTPRPAAVRVAPAARGPVRTPVAAARAPDGPADPSAALGQARALLRRGDWQQALQALARAAHDFPMDPALYQAAAQVALDHGDYAGARRHLKRQLYLEPDSIIAHYLCAVAHMGEGQRGAARRALAASAALLDALDDEAAVPGADGWHAASLRASVEDWMARAA